MATADRAFINAEQRTFDWLVTELADIDGGIKGFIGELPITMAAGGPIVNERQMWCFSLTGQSEFMPSNVNNPVHCHLAAATFRAMTATRQTALRLCGRLRNILPAQIAPLVQRLNLSEGLTISRDTVELANDQDTGGLYRVWLVEQPLWVQFSNDDEEIGYTG